MYLYYICVLRSDFGHVWLLTTLVYILKLLYVNYCVVWRSYVLIPSYFVHFMCLYIFLLLFVRRIVPWILIGIMRHRNVHYYYYKQTETNRGQRETEMGIEGEKERKEEEEEEEEEKQR